DMISHAVKSVRLFVRYVAQNKRLNKFASTVVFVWENISATPANFLMMIHRRDSIIVMVVGSVGLEGRRTSSIATSVVAAIQFF
uniref:hypothetical protein n=1 Tax=Salmonella enterica TaxID=28901 RepID=UPI0032971006